MNPFDDSRRPPQRPSKLEKEHQRDQDKAKDRARESERERRLHEPLISSLNSSTDSLIMDTSPRKERKKYDREMVDPVMPPILRSEKQKRTEDGRRSRVEFIEPPPVEAHNMSISPNPFESKELRAEAPICPEDEFETPRSAPRAWVEQPREVQERVDPRTRTEGLYGKEAAAMEREKVYTGPVCVEVNENVDYIPYPRSGPKSKKGTDPHVRNRERGVALRDHPPRPPSHRDAPTQVNPPTKRYPPVAETSATDSSTIKTFQKPPPPASPPSPKPVEAFVHRMQLSPERATSTIPGKAEKAFAYRIPPDFDKLAETAQTAAQRTIPIDTHCTASHPPEPPTTSSSRAPGHTREMDKMPFKITEKQTVEEVKKYTTRTAESPEDRLRLTKTANEQLSKSGWISPPKQTKQIRLSRIHEMDDLPPPPPPNLVRERTEVPQTLKPRASTLFVETASTPYKSFSERLKQQFVHSPTPSSTSPGPYDMSSPIPPSINTFSSQLLRNLTPSPATQRPPLPPEARQRMLALAQSEKPTRSSKTYPPFEFQGTSDPSTAFLHSSSSMDNSATTTYPNRFNEDVVYTDSEPSLDFGSIARAHPDPHIKVFAHNDKLHIVGI